jgi:hypothetical protein
MTTESKIVLTKKKIVGKTHELCAALFLIKFVFSKKATKFRKISTLLLTTVQTVKSKVEILQNIMAFSEYMNFNEERYHRCKVCKI